MHIIHARASIVSWIIIQFARCILTHVHVWYVHTPRLEPCKIYRYTHSAYWRAIQYWFSLNCLSHQTTVMLLVLEVRMYSHIAVNTRDLRTSYSLYECMHVCTRHKATVATHPELRFRALQCHLAGLIYESANHSKIFCGRMWSQSIPLQQAWCSLQTVCVFVYVCVYVCMLDWRSSRCSKHGAACRQCVCVCMYVCILAWRAFFILRMHGCKHTCVCVCIYVCIYSYIIFWLHIHTLLYLEHYIEKTQIYTHTYTHTHQTYNPTHTCIQTHTHKNT